MMYNQNSRFFGGEKLTVRFDIMVIAPAVILLSLFIFCPVGQDYRKEECLLKLSIVHMQKKFFFALCAVIVFMAIFAAKVQ